jgi:hypothetical protein
LLDEAFAIETERLIVAAGTNPLRRPDTVGVAGLDFLVAATLAEMNVRS